MDPKDKAVARFLARKVLASCSKWAGHGIYGANCALWMVIVFGGGSLVLATMLSPWIATQASAPMWGMSIPDLKVVSMALAAALAAWALFDLRRSPGILANVSWSAPARSAMILGGSGVFLLMDRMGQFLKNFPMGYADMLDLPQLHPKTPAELAGKPWRAAMEPALAQGRLAVRTWRLMPLAVPTMCWGMLSLGLAFALMPLALLEAGILALAAKASAFKPSSLAARAQQARQAWESESADEAALLQAKELDGVCAESAPKGHNKTRL